MALLPVSHPDLRVEKLHRGRSPALLVPSQDCPHWTHLLGMRGWGASSILQMWKLKSREGKCLVQVHTAN